MSSRCFLLWGRFLRWEGFTACEDWRASTSWYNSIVWARTSVKLLELWMWSQPRMKFSNILSIGNYEWITNAAVFVNFLVTVGETVSGQRMLYWYISCKPVNSNFKPILGCIHLDWNFKEIWNRAVKQQWIPWFQSTLQSWDQSTLIDHEPQQ